MIAPPGSARPITAGSIGAGLVADPIQAAFGSKLPGREHVDSKLPDKAA